MVTKITDWGDTLKITVKNSLKDNGYVTCPAYDYAWRDSNAKCLLAQVCIGTVYARPTLVIWTAPMALQRQGGNLPNE